MQYKLFVVPIKNIADAEDELNRFLHGHRILAVSKEFVGQNENSFWTFAVEFLDSAGGSASSGGSGATSAYGKAKPKIDYKEVLSADDFTLFCKLREMRKLIATREAIPVYAVLTNEQLAEIAKRKPKSKSELEKIDGIGEAKSTKYGADFLSSLATESPTERDRPGALDS